MSPWQARHGDAFVEAVDEFPLGKRIKVKDKVLVYGEHTGHSHRIDDEDTDVFDIEGHVDEFGNPDRYIHVRGDEPAPLRHEEHNTIPLPPGKYKLIRQRTQSSVDGGNAYVRD